MKKQIFTAVTSLALVAAMSVSAFAVAPGSTNGTATAKTTVSKEEETKVVLEDVEDVEIVVAAGAFDVAEDVEVEFKVEVEPVAETQKEEVKKTIVTKIAEAISAGIAGAGATFTTAAGTVAQVTVTAVNTKIEISATANNVKVQPNGDIAVTVAYDGTSNRVAHFKDDGTVEMLMLNVVGKVATFVTTSFSDFYMITVAETPETNVPDVTTAATTTTPAPETTAPVKDNPSTGVVLVAIPAAVAAAAVVLSKKRK